MLESDSVDLDETVELPEPREDLPTLDITCPEERSIKKAALRDSICLAKDEEDCDVSVTSSHFSIDSDVDIYLEENMVYVPRSYRLPSNYWEDSERYSPYQPRSSTPLNDDNEDQFN